MRRKTKTIYITAIVFVCALLALRRGAATPIDYLPAIPSTQPATQPYADLMSLKIEIEELKLEVMRLDLKISVQDMKINMLNALIDRMSKPPDVTSKPYKI